MNLQTFGKEIKTWTVLFNPHYTLLNFGSWIVVYDLTKGKGEGRCRLEFVIFFAFLCGWGISFA